MYADVLVNIKSLGEKIFTYSIPKSIKYLRMPFTECVQIFCATDQKMLLREFKEVVNNGLGYGFMYYKGAGKTGTSETFTDTNNDGIIDTETITKTFVGYFPYDNPKFAYSIVAPDISYKSASESNITKRISYNITKKIYEMYIK